MIPTIMMVIVCSWIICNPIKVVSSTQMELIYKQKEIITKQNELLSYAIGQQVNSGTTIYSRIVTLTAYSARKEECNNHPEITANHTPSRVGQVAVSPDLEALGLTVGTRIIITGLGTFDINGVFPVDDRTSTHKRKNTRHPVPITNTIDILHANPAAAKLFGVHTARVIWFTSGV